MKKLAIMLTISILIASSSYSNIPLAKAEETIPVESMVVLTAYESKETQAFVESVPEEKPPEPIVEEYIAPEPRYGFTDEEIYLLAQLLCGDKGRDGDGEYDIDYQKVINYYEVSKVLCVIMNRIRSPRFPNTIKNVVLANRQFSVMPRNLKAAPSEVALKAVREWCTLYDSYDESIQVAPENHLYFTGRNGINVTSTSWK